MKITLLCSDPNHPVNEYLYSWIELQTGIHEVMLLRNKTELKCGEFLFLISCDEIISKKDRENFTFTLVLHASDLPKGRGWSPHIWDIINGANELTLCLLEAEDKIDSGRIWIKEKFNIPTDALYNEINYIVFSKEIEMIDYAINNYHKITPKEQCISADISYYSKRSKQDSQLDPNKTIAEQFNLIRVCDNVRYPAFFIYQNCRYTLTVEKKNDK